MIPESPEDRRLREAADIYLLARNESLGIMQRVYMIADLISPPPSDARSPELDSVTLPARTLCIPQAPGRQGTSYERMDQNVEA